MLWHTIGQQNNFNVQDLNLTHLSSEGSLLNISVGTVGGAFSGRSPMKECPRADKCLSTSSGVMCPSGAREDAADETEGSECNP